MALKVIAFDLDDTLLDTTGLLIPIARTPAFEKRILEPLPLMEGAFDNLEFLSQKYQLALVTMGRTDAQKSKVKSLGIGKYFSQSYFADPATQGTKLECFQNLIQDYQIRPDEFLSVGNRRSMDIRMAKQIGGMTCLFRYGEHLNEKIENNWDRPDFEIDHHRDLIRICQL